MRAWAWTRHAEIPPEVNTRMIELANVISELQGFVSGLGTFANGDTTPSILGSAVFITANTSGTSITTFDDGEPGVSKDLIFGDGNTTLVHGTNLQMASNSNLTGTTGDTRRFSTEDGTIWSEVPQTA